MEPMDKNFRPQGEQIPAPHDHEHSDINVRGIFAFVVFLLVSGVLIHVVLYVLLHFLEKNYEQTQAEQAPRTSISVVKPDHPIHATGDNQLPKAAEQTMTVFERQMHNALNDRLKKFPPPRVQPDDIYDMAVFRYAVDAKLHCGKIPGLPKKQAHEGEEGNKPEAAEQEETIPGCITIDQALDQVAEGGLPSNGKQIAPVRSASGGNIAIPSRSSTNHPKSVLLLNTYAEQLIVSQVPITPPGGSASYAKDNPGQIERYWDTGIEPGHEHEATEEGKHVGMKPESAKQPEPKHE